MAGSTQEDTVPFVTYKRVAAVFGCLLLMVLGGGIERGFDYFDDASKFTAINDLIKAESKAMAGEIRRIDDKKMGREQTREIAKKVLIEEGRIDQIHDDLRMLLKAVTRLEARDERGFFEENGSVAR